MAVHTKAVCGQTLVLQLKFTRDHLSTIDMLYPHLSNAYGAHYRRTQLRLSLIKLAHEKAYVSAYYNGGIVLATIPFLLFL